jgi:hypothetical protein
MPPDGYETVTLPTPMIEELDALALSDSRAGTIGKLIDEHTGDGDNTPFETPARVVKMDADVIEDIANRVASDTADEVQGRFR